MAYPADLESDGFVDATIALLDKFNVIKRPVFQESLIGTASRASSLTSSSKSMVNGSSTSPLPRTSESGRK